MFSNAMRFICVVLLVFSVLRGHSAWEQGDWRRLIGLAAQVLLAVILWLAAPPGASELQPPTAGTRSLRKALYASALLLAMVASTPWPFWFDDSRGSESAVILFFATAVIVPFLQAERRTGVPS